MPFESSGEDACLTPRPTKGFWAPLLAFVRRWDKDALERAEMDARRAEARLREALDILPQGLVFLDREGRYILWNRAYAEIYHRSADLFAPGRRLADTLRIGVERGDYPDAIGREEAWIAERLELMENPSKGHEQQLADGRWVMIEERKTSDGGTIGLRVDITEMKQRAETLRLALARAEAANVAKDEFLANMSHEIRTPLNGVLGVASVLAQTHLDERQRELVRIIESSAEALNGLLTNVLEQARLEAGRLELEIEPFRLGDVVREVADLFRHSAERKGLAFETVVQPEAEALVQGDPARIRQILTNLVANAVKFTPSGSVTVRASPGRLEVADTGIGFSSAQKEALFDRFAQADGSVTRRFGGSGLGLAIVRSLVELMEGRLDAASTPGEGSVFTVTLPLRPVPGKAPAT